MKFTKAQKKLFVEQLKKARPLIKDGRESFVCYALDRSCGPSSANPTKDMIADRLAGQFTVGSWLQQYHKKFYKNSYNPKAYRLAWIDNMIEEFSK